MRALSPPNIESDLSYAYLHAVAAHAGMACSVGNMHEDHNGIDATVTAWGPFEGGGYRSEVTLNVQLKATTSVPSDDGSNFTYFLKGVARYDDLRTETVAIPRILVVLFMPSEPRCGWNIRRNSWRFGAVPIGKACGVRPRRPTNPA